ncbi:efflux RND transporter permease subunit [Hymenobacter sp. PAMC 26628]|uniref:efflux RND transporter permease subunit n=1 Tax=Hymenobacter sp. PAMC 26628 TaxID=1484118 RepID=UPI00077047DC|nr:efflux RND transporter permease subunit [Hymenobacter sp. PAMC 26628]AMJ65062.1 multidrug transporter AcrB [Hymenobacter sp. PAMC 26628]
MLKIFIERPVLSTVISVLIVLLGLLGLYALPIAQYPDISPPTVQVSASYGGASADVVQKSVIVPLEEQINGVEGMTYMTSSATNQGGATIQVYFKVGTNGDQAAVNVQNRVASATSVLPQEVTQAGVQVRKRQTSNLITAAIYSDNPAYDQTFLQNYAEINIIPQLKRVSGVGDASASGQRTYSMRIWLKPDVMANYGLTPADVTTALNQQSLEAAPGKFGENGDQSFQYVIRYSGKLKTPEEFGNIILRDQAQGQLLLLKDVARVELGAQDYSTRATVNGKPSVSVSVNQVAGSNASQVIKDAKAALALAAQDFPAGVHYTLFVDINKFLDASIDKVLHTLFECFALVFLVIFLFLQDFRSTIIHGVSVPVSILGTFFFLYVFGFSINLLTLFALVLAIGIVVDDAIVVVEAVHAKLESGYTSSRKAAIDAMGEISGAIVSITLVMAAVFIPVTFISGSTGVFYKQFGITLAVAILISAVNALTLCPALAALFLKPPAHNQEPAEGEKRTYMQRFGVAFNAGYDALVGKYSAGVGFLSARKWLALVIVAAFGGGLYLLMKTTPSSFVPSEDMGVIFVNITLPPAASLERSAAIADEVDSISRTVPGVANGLRTVGQNSLAGQGSSYAQEVLALKNWDDRPGITNEDVIAQLKKKTAYIRDAKLVFTSLPTISGFGLNGGFEFQLQDRGAHSTDEFYKVAQSFLAELAKRPEIQYATTSFNPTFPQYLLTVNAVKCAEAGITVSSVLAVMQGYYGSLYASNFNEFGKQYRVIVQADTSYRANLAGLGRVQVRTGSNVMAPITEFVTLTRVYGPESVSRFNLYSSMAVQGSPNVGFSTGQALTAIAATAAAHLPPGYSYEFSGLSREESNSGTQAIYVFALCLIFVYLLLSAQYESYLLPFAVLFSLPVGLTGVYVFAKLFGIDNNIYLQISVIMLIGLLSKNAILIVEFAVERRLKGLSIADAALEGAKARLRPILMTSFAFVFGLMPLLFASGAGANGNRSIGAGAIGGMLFGTLLGVFVIPVLYMIFEGLQERINGSPKDRLEQLQREEAEAPPGAPADPGTPAIAAKPEPVPA